MNLVTDSLHQLNSEERCQEYQQNQKAVRE